MLLFFAPGWSSSTCHLGPQSTPLCLLRLQVRGLPNSLSRGQAASHNHCVPVFFPHCCTPHIPPVDEAAPAEESISTGGRAGGRAGDGECQREREGGPADLGCQPGASCAVGVIAALPARFGNNDRGTSLPCGPCPASSATQSETCGLGCLLCLLCACECRLLSSFAVSCVVGLSCCAFCCCFLELVPDLDLSQDPQDLGSNSRPVRARRECACELQSWTEAYMENRMPKPPPT